MPLPAEKRYAAQKPEQLTLFECVSVPNTDRLSIRKGPAGDRVMLDVAASVSESSAAEETYISVANACRLLYGMDPDRLRELLHAGIIQGVRPNLAPGQTPKNHKWRVNMASVMSYRAGMPGGR